MKITLKTFLLAIVLNFSVASGFAHAFWIKTSAAGKIGRPHTIEIFFAEPAGKPELLDSDEMKMVKGFTVWLLAPGKDKKKLVVTPATDHYNAIFTPQSEGKYYIVLQNEEIDVVDYQAAGIYKSDFFASAAVEVGTIMPKVPSASDFKFITNTEGKLHPHQPVVVTLKHTQINLSKVTLSVYNQQGWKLDVKVDSKTGEGTFNVLGAGRYFIEAAYNNKVDGVYNGKSYNSVYYAATEIIEILNQ